MIKLDCEKALVGTSCTIVLVNVPFRFLIIGGSIYLSLSKTVMLSPSNIASLPIAVFDNHIMMSPGATYYVETGATWKDA